MIFYITSVVGLKVVYLELEVREVELNARCPVHAEVEGGGRVLKAHSERLFEPVAHLFHVQHALAQGEDRLDEHPFVPLALATDLEVLRVALSGMEATIAKHDHLGLKALDEAPEDGVVAVGATAAHVHHFSKLIQE